MPTKSPPKWPVYLLLAAAVIVPAVFWQQLWFGGYLSDEEIQRRLSRPENPREVQHACEQISRRMQRDPESARQFDDPLVSLANHSDPQIRCVVAWCMGEDDTRQPPFRKVLRRLVGDEAPRVRYNAALALVRFGDPAAGPVLREMLVPCVVSAQWEGPLEEGTVVDILRNQDSVGPLVQLALVRVGDGEPKPVLAPLAGRVDEVMVRPSDPITKGDRLCTIHPNPQQVFEALRALALVGQPQDLEYIRPYLDPEGRWSRSERTHIQAQARLATDAIQKRHEM